MFVPDGIEEGGESSGIMPLQDWICFSRGGVALNRNVGSLYIVKSRKQSIWCRYWSLRRSGGRNLLQGRKRKCGSSLISSSIFSVK